MVISARVVDGVCLTGLGCGSKLCGRCMVIHLDAQPTEFMIFSRSVYAEKFREVADFAFADGAAFANRGRWREFFGPRIGPAFDGRVILEVGCFDAGFLAKIAAKHPTTAFVGLDWKCKALYDGARQIAEAGLGNVALLRGRAQDVLKSFAEGEVDEIWVFHPDPCDREVELKNRLIAEPFLSDVHRVLRDGTSVLVLKTDHVGYYQWVLGLFGLPEPEWFGERGALAGASRLPRLRAGDMMNSEDIPAPSDVIRDRFEVAIHSGDYWNDAVAIALSAGRCFWGEATLFESRFIKKKQPIYYFEMQKK